MKPSSQSSNQPLSPQELRRLQRRELLKLAPIAALAAFAVPSLGDRLVKRGLALTDSAAERLSLQGLAQTFDVRDLTPLERFPSNSYSAYEATSDLANWTLSVSGSLARPGEYSLEQIRQLPKYAQNVKHICIEGWNAVGNFGGARLSDFLKLVGADPAARFVEVSCLDDYYSSFDMQSCLHPQTLLCYEMYGQPLTSAHGAPVRIHTPVKLGYKSAKHLYELRVVNVLRPERGFWEDQGYSWYGGI